MSTLKIFEQGKDFENRLNSFGYMRFLLAQCKGWKRQTFTCFRCAKFSPCQCKSKIPAHLKHSTQIPTLNIFELRQRFRKSVEYLWRYRFLLAQSTGWKWQNFKCCQCAKFSPCHGNSKLLAHMKPSNQMPTLNIFELRQRFRKSDEYLWRYRIFAVTVNRLKVAKFQMLSMRQVFTLPLQKGKHLRPWNFPP